MRSTGARPRVRQRARRPVRWRPSTDRVRQTRDRAALKPLPFHDLRHTFGTLAVRAFPLTDVKAYLGHADIQTTLLYVHHVPQHDAADKLLAALRADATASEAITAPETTA